jgi:Protein of unknown function (DUF3558)
VRRKAIEVTAAAVTSAAVASAGLIAAGCGSPASKAPTPPPTVADASQVSMCTILTGTELTGLGVRPETRRPFNTGGVVGCRWLGKPYTLSLERDNATLAGYQAHRNDPQYLNFVDNAVNERAGSHFGFDHGGTHCVQLMDGGPVSLSVSVAMSPNLNPQPVDPCAEALRIAQMIEPRLPEKAK